MLVRAFIASADAICDASLDQVFLIRELKKLNSTGYCATGDSVGIVAAILYVVTDIGTSTKGAIIM